jgi:hypothetical protein
MRKTVGEVSETSKVCADGFQTLGGQPPQMDSEERH